MERGPDARNGRRLGLSPVGEPTIHYTHPSPRSSVRNKDVARFKMCMKTAHTMARVSGMIICLISSPCLYLIIGQKQRKGSISLHHFEARLLEYSGISQEMTDRTFPDLCSRYKIGLLHLIRLSFIEPN